MIRIAGLLVAGALLVGAAIAQTPQPPTPAGQTTPVMVPDGAASLSWMQGARVHTNDNGSQVYETFIGPVNGVVTGTALTNIGSDRAYTEYHRIGPNDDGIYGLDVANTRSGMKWSFTPLKTIEPGRITFQSADGKLTIAYFTDGAGGVESEVIRVAGDGKRRDAAIDRMARLRGLRDGAERRGANGEVLRLERVIFGGLPENAGRGLERRVPRKVGRADASIVEVAVGDQRDRGRQHGRAEREPGPRALRRDAAVRRRGAPLTQRAHVVGAIAARALAGHRLGAHETAADVRVERRQRDAELRRGLPRGQVRRGRLIGRLCVHVDKLNQD